MNRETIIYSLKGVCKKIVSGTEEISILNNISLEIKEKESVAIVGASGSGKTTLLHLLGGLDVPSKGHIFFKGRDLADMSEEEKASFRNKFIGFVFQFHHLLPEFTVIENVAMPLFIRGKQQKEAFERAREVISLVGLSHKENQKVPTLSGGERQLIAIARALIGKCRVLLADEPTGNLDFATARKIGKILRKINETLNVVVIVVTHNMELAMEMKRLLKLRNGAII